MIRSLLAPRRLPGISKISSCCWFTSTAITQPPLPDLPAQVANEKLSVALIGKPNVGKSSLFNRLCGRKNAIVADIPGTSRDRNVGNGYIADFPVRVIDTGGFDENGEFHEQIHFQVSQALSEADVVVFLLDGKNGITSIDERIAKWVRKEIGKIESASSCKKKIILAANKTEGTFLSDRVLDVVSESSRLGLGEPLLMSVSHGEGMAELLERLQKCAESKGISDIELINPSSVVRRDNPIQVCIMGRPNVGKSSILNAILKERRVMTGKRFSLKKRIVLTLNVIGSMLNLTRDSILVEWFWNDRFFRLVDTAGVTRPPTKNMKLSAKYDAKKLQHYDNPSKNVLNSYVEKDLTQHSRVVADLSTHSAFNAMRYSHVVILTVEGSQGNFTGADLMIARKCYKEGRGLLVCANKRDLVAAEGVSARQYEIGVRAHCRNTLREFGEVPIVSTSATKCFQEDSSAEYQLAKGGEYDELHHPEGIERLLRAIARVYDSWCRRIDTSTLNTWINDLNINTSSARVNGKVLRIKFITQVKSRPPSFVLFANSQTVPGSYLRFIRNRLQKDFQLNGVPLRFTVRKSKGTETNLAKLSQNKKNRVKSSGESRPLGKARNNRYLEMQRKLSQVERRKRLARNRKSRAAKSRNQPRYH